MLFIIVNTGSNLQSSSIVFPRTSRAILSFARVKSLFKIEYLLVLQNKPDWSFFVLTNPDSMQLMMYLGNDLIEAVQLDDSNIPKPGYVGSFKRSLKEKYNELIRQFSIPPEFLVINPNPIVPKSK